MDKVKSGDHVLVIWNKSDQEALGNIVKDLQGACGNGSVALENSEMLTECKFSPQHFVTLKYQLLYLSKSFSLKFE